MSINIPIQRPINLRSIEVDFGTSIAASIWGRVVDLQTIINLNFPIGMILYFYQSQTLANGSPVTAPGMEWQFCDGSLITNTESPLFNQNIPDLRNKFLRGDTTLGQFGGGVLQTFPHNHGGVTGVESDGAGSNNSDPGFVFYSGNSHSHTVSSASPSFTPLPPYVEMQAYMRIV